MNILAVDWAHKDEKIKAFDGSGFVEDIQADVVLCENIPDHQAKVLLDQQIKILRCSPNDTARYRTHKGVEKTDENDAVCIYELYQAEPDKFYEYIYNPDIAKLKVLYKLRHDQQEMRKRTGNRLFAIGGDDKALDKLKKEMESLEGKTQRQFAKLLKKFPIYTEFLEGVEGVGPVVAAGLIVHTGDIRRWPHLYCLYKAFGLDVQGGEAPKKRKGKAARWNHAARALLLGNLAPSWNRRKDCAYRQMIDAEKERQKSLNPEMSNGHAQNRAFRLAVKRFLKEYFNAYKELV